MSRSVILTLCVILFLFFTTSAKAQAACPPGQVNYTLTWTGPGGGFPGNGNPITYVFCVDQLSGAFGAVPVGCGSPQWPTCVPYSFTFSFARCPLNCGDLFAPPFAADIIQLPPVYISQWDFPIGAFTTPGTYTAIEGPNLPGLGGILTVSLPTTPIDDLVSVTNASPSEIGILVSGHSPSGDWVRRDFPPSPSPFFDLGTNLIDNLLPNLNEVFAFNANRPPTLVSEKPSAPMWTPKPDDIVVPFANEITLPIKVWVLAAPYDTGALKAWDSVLTTDKIWQQERMGLRPLVTIVDATRDPLAFFFRDFHCSDLPSLKLLIGYQSRMINVYLVDTVEGSSWGTSCTFGSGVVILKMTAPTDTLAHEIGHNFMLRHPCEASENPCPNASYFDNTNLMWWSNPKYGANYFMTEGQTFRSHFSDKSVLNTIYNARPGQLTRTCGRDTPANDPACPAYCKRIWPDGAFQPAQCTEP